MIAPVRRVLIDACVLYPNVLREIVLGVAATGVFVPLWSPRILDEWRHAAARLGPEGAVFAAGEVALLRARWPDAEVTPAPGLEATLDLPDLADRHVLAAAITGGAGLILTQNLRDFPARALSVHGLRARAPDDFLMDLWLADPAGVEAPVARVRAETERLSGRAQPPRALLRRVRLPRLGKALAP
jgi:hypothetical protein